MTPAWGDGEPVEIKIKVGCDECGGPFDDDPRACYGHGWLCSECGHYRSKDRARGEGKTS